MTREEERERDRLVVLAKREGYVEGVRGECVALTDAALERVRKVAAARYPLPKITRARVLKFSRNPNAITYESGMYIARYRDSMTEGWSGYPSLLDFLRSSVAIAGDDLSNDDIVALMDLAKRPTELVDDDGESDA